MRPVVLIATKGRPEVLQATLDSVTRQTLPPKQIIVVGTAREDVPATVDDMPGTRVLFGGPGLTIQRNVGLDAVPPDADPIIFFDDDVELAEDYLRQTVAFLESNPDVVGMCGVALLDAPCTREEALRIVREDTGGTPRYWEADGLYGCNMVLRAAPARGLRFDERLALYGWLEDKDFSVRLGRRGRLVSYDGARLVHMAVRTGRVSGRRLGFAQVMNPVYLWRVNGTISTALMLRYVGRALAVNAVGSLYPKEFDGLGRLRGNLRALSLLARGRVEPEAVREVG